MCGTDRGVVAVMLVYCEWNQAGVTSPVLSGRSRAHVRIKHKHSRDGCERTSKTMIVDGTIDIQRS